MLSISVYPTHSEILYQADMKFKHCSGGQAGWFIQTKSCEHKAALKSLHLAQSCFFIPTSERLYLTLPRQVQISSSRGPGEQMWRIRNVHWPLRVLPKATDNSWAQNTVLYSQMPMYEIKVMIFALSTGWQHFFTSYVPVIPHYQCQISFLFRCLFPL